MGWFQTVALVFFSVVIRPRFLYLVASSTASFTVYAVCAQYLKNPINNASIAMRCMVYFCCCLFNVYANWSLAQSERKAYFLSKDLRRKLASEKSKLQALFKRTTELKQELAEEREQRLRNLAEEATHLFEAERAKPLWHIQEEDIKCLHTRECFKSCECGKRAAGIALTSTVHYR
jgi:hypothetical protein